MGIGARVTWFASSSLWAARSMSFLRIHQSFRYCHIHGLEPFRATDRQLFVSYRQLEDLWRRQDFLDFDSKEAGDPIETVQLNGLTPLFDVRNRGTGQANLIG